MSRTTRLLLCVILAATSGCAVRQDQMLPFATKRAPISPDDVKIYETAPEHYEAVARIQSTSVNALSGRKQSLETVRQGLLRQAADLGANGILLDSPLAESGDKDDFYATEVNALAIWVP